MRRRKLYQSAWAVAGVLALLNVALLLYVVLDPGDKQQHFHPQDVAPEARMMDYFSRRMKLEPKQKASFSEAWRSFHEESRSLQRELLSLRDEFHQELVSETRSNARLDSLSGSMAELVEERERLLTQHFDRLYALCRPDQQATLRQIFKRMLRPGPGPRRSNGPSSGPPGGPGPRPGFIP